MVTIRQICLQTIEFEINIDLNAEESFFARLTLEESGLEIVVKELCLLPRHNEPVTANHAKYQEVLNFVQKDIDENILTWQKYFMHND